MVITASSQKLRSVFQEKYKFYIENEAVTPHTTGTLYGIKKPNHYEKTIKNYIISSIKY